MVWTKFETNKTDKDALLKGLNKMGLSLIFMFLEPTLVNIAFRNREKTLYIPILVTAITISTLAVYFCL